MAHAEKKRHAYKVLVGKPKGKGLSGTPKGRQQDLEYDGRVMN